MKKLMGILLAASMVFSLAACGSTADTAASSAAGTTATAEGSSNNQAPDVKVGAIILGDETEGYSAAHINGIKEAAAELGMSDDQIVWKYKIAEGGVTADAAEDLVGQGCNLIISNSYGHQTYMEEEAEKYPEPEGTINGNLIIDSTLTYFSSVAGIGMGLLNIAAGVGTVYLGMKSGS